MTTPTPDSVDSQIAAAEHLPDWSRGNPITAKRLTTMTQAINRNAAQIMAPQMLLRAARGAAAAVAGGTRLEVMEYGRIDLDTNGPDFFSRATFPNHIICRRETTDDEGVTAWVQVMVAKPLHLQAQNSWGIRRLDRPSAPDPIRIDYGNSVARVANDVRLAQRYGTTDEEFQFIIPSYEHGDEERGSDPILVGHVGFAITGVTVHYSPNRDDGYLDENGDLSPVEVGLMDMSTHRNWCHPPTETPRPNI
ncbi:MAG: hypothetical protein ACYSWU_28950 [Planctomycetota bacterium]|jgi:hypothetical protein